MEKLATDVLREMKKKLRCRMIIIIISLVFLFVTNILWFAIWNSPPKEKDEIEIIVGDEEDDDDPPQGSNEKSE